MLSNKTHKNEATVGYKFCPSNKHKFFVFVFVFKIEDSMLAKVSYGHPCMAGMSQTSLLERYLVITFKSLPHV